jgi:hypothetical protein
MVPKRKEEELEFVKAWVCIWVLQAQSTKCNRSKYWTQVSIEDQGGTNFAWCMQLANLGSDTPENTSSRFSDNEFNIIIIIIIIICSNFECKKNYI